MTDALDISDKDLAKMSEFLGSQYAQLGLALIAIAKALRPTDAAGLQAFRDNIRESISRSKPEHDFLKTLLEYAAE